jgi:hypothetical protein
MKGQHIHGHWGKFNDALAALDALIYEAERREPSSYPYMGQELEARDTWNILRTSFPTTTKFYVPDTATAVLNEGMLRHPVRLPYESVAILAETPNSVAGKFTLIIACHPPKEPGSGDGDIMFWSAVLTPKGWGWSPLTWVAAINPSAMYSAASPEKRARSVYASMLSKYLDDFELDNLPKDEYVVYPILSADTVDYINGERVDLGASISATMEDMRTIAVLCSLLEVHDAETPVVAAPPKLQAKRTKHGKVPLYDYHVLRIGGETWDNPYVSSGTGAGRRSHLRRGHIRRLEGKTVWVRATYVHGSKDGFLHKDYEVIPPKKGSPHALRQ